MTLSADAVSRLALLANLACVAVAAMLATVAAWAAIHWINGDAASFLNEEGPIETLHNVLLGLAAVVFTASVFQSRSGVYKLGGSVLAGVAAIGLIRELDLGWFIPFVRPEDFGMKDTAGWVMAPVALLVLIGVFRWRADLAGAIGLAFKWASWPTYLAAFFIAAGILVDSGRLDLHDLIHVPFWEELAETFGYGFLLYAGIRHWELGLNEQV